MREGRKKYVGNRCVGAESTQGTAAEEGEQRRDPLRGEPLCLFFGSSYKHGAA